MVRKIMLILSLIIFSLFVLSACQSETDELKEENPEILALEEFAEDTGDENFAGQGASAKSASSSSLGTCYDTDGGIIYTTQGTTGYTNGGSRTDACLPTSSQPERLIEYYCYQHPNGNSYAAGRSENCANKQMVCLNGACALPVVNTVTENIEVYQRTNAPEVWYKINGEGPQNVTVGNRVYFSNSKLLQISKSTNSYGTSSYFDFSGLTGEYLISAYAANSSTSSHDAYFNITSTTFSNGFSLDLAPAVNTHTLPNNCVVELLGVDSSSVSWAGVLWGRGMNFSITC